MEVSVNTVCCCVVFQPLCNFFFFWTAPRRKMSASYPISSLEIIDFRTSLSLFSAFSSQLLQTKHKSNDQLSSKPRGWVGSASIVCFMGKQESPEVHAWRDDLCLWKGRQVGTVGRGKSTGTESARFFLTYFPELFSRERFLFLFGNGSFSPLGLLTPLFCQHHKQLRKVKTIFNRKTQIIPCPHSVLRLENSGDQTSLHPAYFGPKFFDILILSCFSQTTKRWWFFLTAEMFRVFPQVWKEKAPTQICGRLVGQT